MNFVHPPSNGRLAARAVALHAPGSRTEQKALLDMLGLLSDDGQLQELSPSLTGAYGVEGSTDRVIPSAHLEPPWDRSNVPPGLRDLPPPPRVRRSRPGPTPKPRTWSGCGDQRGTVNGRNRHRREGSEVCEACRLAWNEYQRIARPKTNTREMPPRPETCGTLAGRSNHQRRGEKLCRACKDAANAHARSRRQRKEAA